MVIYKNTGTLFLKIRPKKESPKTPFHIDRTP